MGQVTNDNIFVMELLLYITIGLRSITSNKAKNEQGSGILIYSEGGAPSLR